MNERIDPREGNKLIASAGEVMPDEAPERIAPIYTSIRETLRVPFVNFIFRSLATRPDYIEAAWNELQPFLATLAFERAADKLRAVAVLDLEPKSLQAALERTGEAERIMRFTDSIHYVLPKLLLIATAWEEGLSPSVAARTDRTVPDRDLPLGPAPGTEKVELIDPNSADGRLRHLFEDIRDTHGHPGVASYYRALGHWPDFLQAAWDGVKPHLRAPAYDIARRELVRSAVVLVRRLSLIGPRVDDPHMASELRKMLSVFRDHLIPELLLDVSIIKVSIGGTDSVRSSRFSA